MQHPPPPSSSGVHAASDASAPLENELRELITKMQQSFTQLIHHSAAIIGDSVEDKNALIDESEGPDADLAHLLEIGGQSSGSGSGSSGAGLSADKLKPVPPRKSLPVQKLSYSQLQTSALKQTYQTAVNANNLVHHTHSLMGLVARLKLAVLLAHSAQDAARQGKTGNAPESPEAAAAQSSLRHPLEAPIHPGAIPAHLLPLHMQRTQQQLHDSGLDLYAQVCEIDRQLEDAALDAEDAARAKRTEQHMQM